MAKDKFTSLPIERIEAYELPVSDAAFEWGEANAASIKKFWNKQLMEKPAMFNGDIMLMTGHSVNDGVLAGEAVRAKFADLLYLKEKAFPAEANVSNVFGCAVVRSADGHLLFAHMGPETAAAGRVYPMAGTPDPEDIKDGVLDIEGSIVRELKEESGLEAADATRQPGYLMIDDGGMLALCAVFDFDAPSRELKARMMQHIDMQDEPELDDIVVFRRAAFHVHHRMPRFARTLILDLLE